MKTILCFGDSNTWGYEPGTAHRYPPEVRWPGPCAAALGDGYALIEEGLNSRTTVFDDPLAVGRNGATYLVPCLASHAPLDGVVLSLGCNDLKARFALPAGDVALGVERLIEIVRGSAAGPDGAEPALVVVAPPPMGPFPSFGAMFDGAEAKSRDLAPAIRAAAERHGAAFVDAGEHVTVSPIDGVHVTPEGHAALGVAIAEAVRSRV